MKITEMTREHKECVKEMMRVFYASEAVLTNGSDEIFDSDIENCVNDCPYLEGYVFTEDEIVVGYAMTAKSFSTEFGKPCIWIEDIYLKPEYRSKGIGGSVLNYISKKYPDSVLRLEAERENEHAVYVYKKNGFEELPYMELIKL